MAIIEFHRTTIVEFSEQATEQLKNMRESTGHANHADLVKRALQFYELCLRNGDEVTLVKRRFFFKKVKTVTIPR